jgi:hypothetical protein
MYLNRRTNLAFVPRSAASGSMSSSRARLAQTNSTSPSSSRALSTSPAATSASSSATSSCSLASTSAGRGPDEADAGGALGELHRAGEGGQADRHVVEQAGRRGRGGLGRALLRLDRLPGLGLLGRRAVMRLAEHVRVAAHHLVVDRLGDRGEVERALFLGHARVEHHLQQQVAEFLLQVGEVAALDRVGDLVGLLDGVGGDGGEGLLQVPRAAAVGERSRAMISTRRKIG